MLDHIAFYKQQFLLQLLIGEGIFLFRLEKRASFRYLAPLSVAMLFLLTFFLPKNSSGPFSSAAQYLFMFGCSLVAIRLCFVEPFQNLLFCGIAGYTIQHLSYLIFTILAQYVFSSVGLLGVPVVDPYSPSGATIGHVDPTPAVLYVGIYVVDYIVVFFLVYLTAFDLFDPFIRANHDLRLGHTNYILLTGLLIAVDVIGNMLTLFYTAQHTVSNALELGYNILLCLLILALIYNQLSRRALRDELSAVRVILEQSERQYETAKKTQELINIKYHDLRHQYTRMEQQGSIFQGEREELKQLLNDYDIQIQTGNEVLDVILTEKNLLCRKENIQLLCMADGAGLDFMKPHHLYALLSNAIENAMEAVLKLPEDERFIHLYIRRQGKLFHIRVENAFQGILMLRNGLPLTRKEDPNYHGFGMLSMKTIAESYGGELNVALEDGTFCLDVLLVDPA